MKCGGCSTQSELQLTVTEMWDDSLCVINNIITKFQDCYIK